MFPLPSSSSNSNTYYHPHVHSNTSDTSSFLYPNDSSTNYADDERLINNKHQSRHSEGLQTIQRKINKQKIAAERRTEQTNTGHMLESSHRRQRSPFTSRPVSSQSFPTELDSALRHSANSRMLHAENDVILSGDFQRQEFHQPNTRKVTKIVPKENYSLSNSRPTQPRSASASNAPTRKRQSKDPLLTPSEAQRLNHVRRHEPAHVQSGPGSKTSLITPDSWRTDPVPIKKIEKKKPPTETVKKQSKINDISEPIVEQLSTKTKQQTEKPTKPKRDKSASKPSAPTTTEKTPAKPPPKLEKTKEEKEKLKIYIEQKRQEHDEKLLIDKKLKTEQEIERKDKLKKLDEQIKKVAQLPLPPGLIKKLSTSIPPKDSTEPARERLLQILGPRPINELPTEYHHNTPFEEPSLLERSASSSSSSSSSDSIVEIQPPRLDDQAILRARSEPPIQNGVINSVEPRQHNLLRWAVNLTRYCSVVENKFKYLRPDGTQPFDLIPSSHKQLQHEDGNLRFPIPVLITNNNAEPIVPSKLLRPSGRLSHLNQNLTSEYQGQQLPGVGDLRDPLLERRIRRDRAAAKIQAVYRGYTVRKSLRWFNDKEKQLKNESNKRSIRKPSKTPSYTRDPYDMPPANLDMRFSDDNFTIGSTLLRHFERNGTHIISPPNPPISNHHPQQRPTTLEIYSDDYENVTSTISSTPVNHKQLPQKPRIIQQPVLNIQRARSPTSSSSSSSSPSSSSSSITLTPTPEPRVPSNVQHRRSISPPLPPQMSPNNGRLLHHHHPRPLPPPSLTSHRILDERRYSPDALERQLNAELHLLDGVEASMQQVDNMERLRSVALAQQEVVSLAQVLQNRPATETQPQQQIRKMTARQTSSSSSSTSSPAPTNQKRRSSSPQQPIHSRHRTTQPSSSPSSSSESILTAREKRARQKFHSENEVQAYEKRLKDIEKKIRLLVKRENNDDPIDYERLESILNAFEIFDKKPAVSIPLIKPKSSNESSISEDIPASHKSSSSISSTVHRKTDNDTSEIHTEPIKKDSDSISTSIHQHSDIVTSGASDIERRIHAYREQLKTRKSELDKLKQRKNKEALRRQEDELKKQLHTYEHEIETLRLQPASPKIQQEKKVAVPSRRSPMKSDSSSSSSSSTSISTARKKQESSIAEDLPVTSSASHSKNVIVEKRVEKIVPPIKKERNFFDDDDDEEEEKEKERQLKLLETSRDERDTQHDAHSLSIATDSSVSSEPDNNSRRPSTDNEKSILNLNANPPLTSKTKQDSSSSSSTKTSSKSSPKEQLQSSFEKKQSPVHNDYDEDFSEVSHSAATPTKEILPKNNKIDDIDIESIQEDLDDKPSLHDTNQSLTSKSSGDEQSEILVLVKKSASNTPRRQDDKTPEEEFFPPPPPPPPSQLPPLPKPKMLSNGDQNNDDTSHDVSEDDEVNERVEQENKIDKLTDVLIRTFIDEAIDEGKQIGRLKKENNPTKIPLTNEVKEWLLDDDDDDDSTDEESDREIIIRHENDNDHIIPTIQVVQNDNDIGFELDLSRLDGNNTDEPRVESPRKPVIEEPVKPIVPHTREQVVQLSHQAMRILFDQNINFSDRSKIKCIIPDSYFTYDQQDSDNEDTRRNRHAYCQMIFDLCVEMLNEMYTENVQPSKYPDWQKAKLVSKRFYRANKPENHQHIEQIIQTKVLELLNLNSRHINYPKWRVSNSRRNGPDKFETVLDEELRRAESQWVNYDDDCIQMKFDIADSIFDQLVQETLTECFHIVDQRLFLNSNSTRL